MRRVNMSARILTFDGMAIDLGFDSNFPDLGDCNLPLYVN